MTLAERVVAELKRKNLVLTTAESCTGGLAAKLVTDVPGASRVFECGIVSYSDRVKAKLLGVPEAVLELYGAVSEQTALLMAQGARELTGADVAVSVTGAAGPDSDGRGTPVGLIYVAAVSGEKTIVKKILNRFDTNVRERNREAGASCALQTILEVLRNERG